MKISSNEKNQDHTSMCLATEKYVDQERERERERNKKERKAKEQEKYFYLTQTLTELSPEDGRPRELNIQV